METRKENILNALDAFVRQRAGLEYGNYNDVVSYRAEQRSITKDLHHYRTLRAAVAWRDSLTAADLIRAFRDAYSGRLSLQPATGPIVGDGFSLSYCTGQYFPTEYRKAACAVLASAFWAWTRDQAMPSEIISNGEKFYPHCNGGKNLQYGGDWLRGKFKKEFGAGLASRYFN